MRHDNGTWHPPLLVDSFSDLEHGWQVSAIVNLDMEALLVKVIDPAKGKQSYKIPFKSIFATCALPEDTAAGPSLYDWALDVLLIPWKTIKATIYDPWGKSYLLNITMKTK